MRNSANIISDLFADSTPSRQEIEKAIRAAFRAGAAMEKRRWQTGRLRDEYQAAKQPDIALMPMQIKDESDSD